MKKLLSIALLSVGISVSGQTIKVIQVKPKPAQFTLRMNYGLKERAGFSTEILIPTERRVLVGFNFMFNTKSQIELTPRDSYSSEFMLGMEVLPHIIIGAKAGWSTREQVQGTLISQTSKSQTQSYGGYYTTFTTTDNVYDVRTISMYPAVGGFITTTTNLSPLVGYDSFSGIIVTGKQIGRAHV